MIRFEDGEPTGIYFSQHSDGQAMEWDDPELSKVDGRVSYRFSNERCIYSDADRL